MVVPSDPEESTRDGRGHRSVMEHSLDESSWVCSPLGSSVHGILQARILEWVAIPFSRGSSRPRDQTQVSRIAGGYFTICATREAPEVKVLVALSCPTLCHPMDCSLPGSSVHGILQARILQWVAIPFSRRSSRPWDQTQVSCIAGRSFSV